MSGWSRLIIRYGPEKKEKPVTHNYVPPKHDWPDIVANGITFGFVAWAVIYGFLEWLKL